MSERPLSPHLSVYRFMYTMALSIAHRFTGVGLAMALCALVYWLASAAAGEGEYQRAVTLLSAWPARLLLLAWLAAFCYHLANGIRHLIWDAGFGLEKAQARRSARVVIVVAALGFLLAAWLLYGVHRGAP